MGNTYQTDAQMVGCRFCSLLAGGEDSFDSIWLGESSYKALVSVGAFVPGWTLICPVHHVVNLAEEYQKTSFWDFATAASEVIGRRYGKQAYFEHGASCETSLTGCGVGHAHGHLVPLDFSLDSEARLFAPELDWQECRAADIGRIVNGAEYLFVASEFDGSETRGSLSFLDVPRSQFFRQVIAKRLGIGQLYDYKKYPMREIASTSAAELRADVSTLAVGA